MLRSRSRTLMLVGMPIVFLLLFVYAFGGRLGGGLGYQLAGGRTGRPGYLNYVAPGILLMTVAAAVQGTAIVVTSGPDTSRPPPRLSRGVRVTGSGEDCP